MEKKIAMWVALTLSILSLFFYAIAPSSVPPNVDLPKIDNNITTLPKLSEAPMTFKKILIDYTKVNTVKDIKPIIGPAIKPITYTSVVSLNKLPVKEKKKKFFDLLLPSVLIAKQQIEAQRQQVKYLLSKNILTPQEQTRLDDLKEQYKAQDYQQLLRRLSPHPTSIVLAQAAIETGWGTSRFFVQANNTFGVWSFNPNEKRIPASEQRDDNTTVYLKHYDTLIDSIHDYFKTIAISQPFQNFRDKRLTTNDVFELLPYLSDYSELGEEYVRRLELVIKANNLTRFDAYQLITPQ